MKRKRYPHDKTILNTAVGILVWLFMTANVFAEEQITYYHTDALGSIVAATDENGDVIWRESYRPYGDRIEKAVPTEEHALFYTGKPHDDETGLSYFGARYYEPRFGRFISIDPVDVDPENPHSLSRYAYANNNPYRYVDPDGAYAEDLFLALPGILTGAHSLWQNLSRGEFLNAAIDGGGILVDAGALALPGVPGGAGLAIKASREAAEAATKSVPKSLKDQAADLIPQNANRHRVTLRSPSQKMEVDPAGKAHGGIPTPHTKVSPRNYKAPNQPAYNTKNAPVRPATQQDIRTVRRYLERQGR